MRVRNVLVGVLSAACCVGGSRADVLRPSDGCDPQPNAIEMAADGTTDPFPGVNFNMGEYVYMGNAFDFAPADMLKEIDLTFYVSPDFTTNPVRVWVHSAKRDCSGIDNVRIHYDRILDLNPDDDLPGDGIEYLEPGAVWPGVPQVHAVWVTLSLEGHLLEGVPPGNDLIAVGYTARAAGFAESASLPGLTTVAQVPEGDPPPLGSSLVSDANGVVRLGLTWQRIEEMLALSGSSQFTADELRAKLGCHPYVGDTYVQIHARPSDPGK